MRADLQTEAVRLSPSGAFGVAMPSTLEAPPPSFLDTLSRRSLHALFGKITRGCLVLVDGADLRVFGRREDPLTTTVTVHDPSVYRAILLGGSVGAGEAYMKGQWSCDDLAALARILTRNIDALDAMDSGAARLASRAGALVTAAARRNTRAGSRRNIARHYDLSNEFFRLFLDDSMMYSSAIFEWEDTSLGDAQRAKLDRICQKLDLQPEDHLLEIGTGWGGLAIHAAGNYGCRVTTTTISREQHRLATERVQAAGLADRVEVLLRDYRDLEGTYDKLVSIEMIEAVGHEYLDSFFGACSARLAPHGVMLLQAITIADQHHERHRASVDFIKEYIFPGSCIPSVTSMVTSVTRATDLRLSNLEDLTPHYARTLRMWRERFLAEVEAVRGLGFDDAFIRMWEYYLAYCEGGFQERYLGCLHLTFTKPDARGAALPKRR
jgi:cyclopropane-fatty-acyl-phospholipid synthase